ncbi:LytR/AlgR family response regulator transcription factor [Paraflavitalea pollutisoli]|uniref:LytR/AlgR family response regulator transcription factor n=1 Tax=Paraflavitalea pollutisoli TaxID=3034143 RepID=UPI0023EAA1D4|nr:LytTR family DNA-binding domain-containing protein [Paraflavitalea sp. H1-2-19X]
MSTLYRCLVVEDEPLAQNVLKNYISSHPLLELAGLCGDSLEAQQWLVQHRADLLFLDINLPVLSGVSFLKSLSRPPLVIFTTAYAEYAAEGFELDAVDYLVKPFSVDRFLKAVNKALEKLVRQPISNVGFHEPFIFVKADKKVYKINLSAIEYIEALDDYVKIVTGEGSYLVHDTMKGMQEQLPAGEFIRVHKSFIIVRSKIVFIEGNYVRISDRDIPIGASYREEVFSRLKL